MSESSKIGESGKAAQKARQERRLAAALRENLKRRKAQAKGAAPPWTGTDRREAAPQRPPSPTTPPELPTTTETG